MNKTEKMLFGLLGALVLIALAVAVLLAGRGGREKLPSSPAAQASAAQPGQAANRDTIDIPGYRSLKIAADTQEQPLRFYNPAENGCWFRITLELDDGTELWVSDLLAPGDTVDSIRLSQPLQAGSCGAHLIYECFSMDDPPIQLNGANVELELIIA